MPPDAHTAHVDLSMLFGNVRVYGAMNRKPTPSSFDYSNAFSGQQDFLLIVSYPY